MSGESFLSHEKWQIKLLGDFLFTIHIVHFTNDSNSRNNNSQGFKDSQMDMRGCVWVEESFLWNDKWQIKLLSQFFPIHIQPFTNDSNSKTNNS